MGRLERFWVWVADNLVWNGEIRGDVHDFGLAGLSEENREADTLHGLSVHEVDLESHQLRVRHAIDPDALKRP